MYYVYFPAFAGHIPEHYMTSIMRINDFFCVYDCDNMT